MDRNIKASVTQRKKVSVPSCFFILSVIQIALAGQSIIGQNTSVKVRKEEKAI
jgi:hypothetical protein